MEFDLIEEKFIPKFAWLLKCHRGEKKLTLFHGSAVDVENHFFLEGGWDGEFNELEFDQSIFFLGSGGKIQKDKLILSTPNHTLERIYSIEIDDNLYFSNSFPFILNRTQSETDKNFFQYEEYFATILNGIKDFEKDIPLANNRKVRLYYCCNILLDSNFNIEIQQKQGSPEFHKFEEYMNALNNYIKAFRKNVNSIDRKRNYEFITTISAGYDASATSVIAKTHDCEIAVTFDTPEKYKVDSGEQIANLLNFETVICDDANKYLTNNELIEAEYLCSGELGTGIVFYTFDKLFEDKVVFMGERGDKFWSTNWPYPNNYYKVVQEIYAGTSMIETRLRLGYIYFPLPIFGADRWTDLYKISNSQELKKYSVGGSYDRPIPRKIVEDAGIPRKLFGFKKMGVGFNYRFDNNKRMQSRISKHSLEHFQENYKSKNSLKRFYYFLRFLYFNKEFYINFLLEKVGINYQLKVKNHFASNPYTSLDLFNWSVEVMKKRYDKI